MVKELIDKAIDNASLDGIEISHITLGFLTMKRLITDLKVVAGIGEDIVSVTNYRGITIHSINVKFKLCINYKV